MKIALGAVLAARLLHSMGRGRRRTSACRAQRAKAPKAAKSCSPEEKILGFCNLNPAAVSP